MRTVYLGWEVVWSLPLIVAVVGAELTVMGVVGVVAATPQGSTVILPLSPGGSANVTFMPTPVWGARSFDLVTPSTGQSGIWSCPASGCPEDAEDVLMIQSCLDAGCHLLGSFRAMATLWYSTGALVQVPTRASTFLFTLLNGSASLGPIGVQMVWWDSMGVVQGLTTLSAAFAWAGIAGLGTCVGAWMISKRSGRRWVREFALVGSLSREIRRVPRIGS